MKFHFVLLLNFCLFAAAALNWADMPARSATDPWAAAETIRPERFAKELKASTNPPTVVFVGFKRLYAAGHIRGAQFHGTAGSKDGLKELKAWAASLPRSTILVIYCGCCPMEHCPNIRPAFTALRELGFIKVRVLSLTNTFETDWAAKGFPYDKGE